MSLKVIKQYFFNQRIGRDVVRKAQVASSCFMSKRLRVGSVFANQVGGNAFDNVFKQPSKLQFNMNKATGIKSE